MSENSETSKNAIKIVSFFGLGVGHFRVLGVSGFEIGLRRSYSVPNVKYTSKMSSAAKMDRTRTVLGVLGVPPPPPLKKITKKVF